MSCFSPPPPVLQDSPERADMPPPWDPRGGAPKSSSADWRPTASKNEAWSDAEKAKKIEVLEKEKEELEKKYQDVLDLNGVRSTTRPSKKWMSTRRRILRAGSTIWT